MNFLSYSLISVLAFILSLLPIRISSWLATQVGHLSFICLPRRKKIALANLDRVFKNTLTTDQKEAIVKKSFINAALSLLELFMVRQIRPDLSERMKLHGRENIEKAIAENKGVILMAAHLGSWEYLAFLSRLVNCPIAVAVKSVKNQMLNQKITELRNEIGSQPIAKVGSIKTMLTEIKKKHIVAVLIDQWAGPEGIWTSFFGIPTSTTSLPARLAEKTGALIVPAYCIRTAWGKYEIHTEPAVEWNRTNPHWEKDLTQQLNLILEKQIQKFPDQWTWGHRRWKEKPKIIRET